MATTHFGFQTVDEQEKAKHVRSVFDVESVVQAARFTRERLRALPFAMAPTLFRITLWRRGD